MKIADTTSAGRLQVALSYSFPHRFWIVTGQERERVEIQSDDSVHLMLSAWDEETGTVVPAGDLRVEITRDDESITSKSMWPMLSQNMGLHFGDNVALPDEGTYTVDVTIAPLSTRRTGAFRDAFGESVSETLPLEFDREELEEVMFEELDRAGERDAVDPMEMETMPIAQLPSPDQLPGRVLGDATSGDGVFVAVALEEPPEGIDEDGSYLAISARTPYNRYPLPFTSLSAHLEGSGETIVDDDAVATFDPDLGYHYGVVADDLDSGETLGISVGAPPQVARHEGYETAFFDMDDMEITL